MSWFDRFKQKDEPFSFKCGECGETHSEFSFSFPLPALITGWSEVELKKRVYFSNLEKPDLIVVDDKYYFVRSILEIPIKGTNRVLTFGVWPSLSEEKFYEYQDLFESDKREGKTAFSWQFARMPHYVSEDEDGHFLALKATTIWKNPPLRPLVCIHECDHELYFDQINGVSKEKSHSYRKINLAWE